MGRLDISQTKIYTLSLRYVHTTYLRRIELNEMQLFPFDAKFVPWIIIWCHQIEWVHNVWIHYWFVKSEWICNSVQFGWDTKWQIDIILFLCTFHMNISNLKQFDMNTSIFLPIKSVCVCTKQPTHLTGQHVKFLAKFPFICIFFGFCLSSEFRW